MPTPRALLRFAVRRLRLQQYLAQPGDGRPQPTIAARTLLWALLVGRVLRECSFLGVEQTVQAAWGVIGGALKTATGLAIKV